MDAELDGPLQGYRTWDEGKRCAECCNGDRCDDPTHWDRRRCPHCLSTGWALWTETGRADYAKYRGWSAYRDPRLPAPTTGEG